MILSEERLKADYIHGILQDQLQLLAMDVELMEEIQMDVTLMEEIQMVNENILGQFFLFII